MPVSNWRAYYERHIRDFPRALEFAQLGLKMLRCGFCGSRYSHGSRHHARQLERSMCRVERLQHRMKSVAAADGPLLAQVAASGTPTRRPC